MGSRPDGTSVNANIPKDRCSVKYPDFEDAMRLCLSVGKSCFIGKLDMSSAFRHVLLRKDQWFLMIMKAYHPVTNQVWYFVDKCLPFRSSISCAFFQSISDAITFIVWNKTRKPIINYLDDYLFTALRKWLCDQQIGVFLDICKDINFPVALEKTFWGTNLLTFLGLLLDTVSQGVCIPLEKVRKVMDLVEFLGGLSLH